MIEKILKQFMFDFDLTVEDITNCSIFVYEMIQDFNRDFELNFDTFSDFIQSKETLHFTATFYVMDEILYMIYN